MRIFSIGKTVRSVRRYQDILQVLVKYGFDDFIDRLRLDVVIREGRRMLLRKKGKEFRQKSRPERIRLALEELGPTFIKFGQMLSTRVDLLPADYIQELKKLQNEVAPFPFDQARMLIEMELGSPVDALFDTLDETPLAAASLAQVHRAVTKFSEDVVIKTQRPGIQRIIEDDLIILSDMAALIARHIPEAEPYDPVSMIDEFCIWIRQELDFYQEGRNIERFRKNFEGDGMVRLPAVNWELTTGRILTMEYIQGIPILDLEELAAAGLDRKIIARNGAHLVLKQIFEHGYFHGDPHPGNILVLENHTIVPLDFGLVGRLDDDLILQLSNLMRGVVERNTDRIVRVMMNLGSITDSADTIRLKSDLMDLIDRYYQIPLSRIRMDQIMGEVTRLVTRHRIHFPRNLYLMGKALMVMEGVGKTLDPDFDMVGLAKPYIRRFMFNQYTVQRFMKNAAVMLEEYVDLLQNTPGNLKRIMLKIRRGELGINLHHQGLDRLIREMDKSTNRISFSLIIASLIIASSLITQLSQGPMIFGLPAFGLIGYIIAGILGLWLAIAILRSGRL